MRFINHIVLRVSLWLSVVIAVWAVLFFFIIVDEVNDETDDVLEDYSAIIIQNFLTGEPLPTADNGSNNSYSLRPVSPDSIEIVRRQQGFFNQSIYVEYKREDEPARVLRQLFCDASDNYYEVMVLTPTIDNSDLIDAIWRSLAILFILLLVTTLLVNIVAIRGGLKPLDRFMKWLNGSDLQNCELPTIQHSNIREIKELSVAIEAFAERGKRAFEEQKEFIGNASHELQTPIAICQNRLELLCQSGLSEEQMGDVAECLATLSRLSRLNKSLLMLSKIENGGFENMQVDINAIVRKSIETLVELYEHRNIKLTYKEQGECKIEANDTLSTTLIINLIKNSYSHNIEGGEIFIETDYNMLTISNSSDSIELDSEKIFSRFYQGRSKGGSYGLGLPIVQSICKLYDYKISYSYSNNLHRFQINFK
ncbi:MAG: HAMP domain-containing sensor histidine kinase [Rikenellaceae bacterium]